MCSFHRAGDRSELKFFRMSLLTSNSQGMIKVLFIAHELREFFDQDVFYVLRLFFVGVKFKQR